MLPPLLDIACAPLAQLHWWGSLELGCYYFCGHAEGSGAQSKLKGKSKGFPMSEWSRRD